MNWAESQRQRLSPHAKGRAKTWSPKVQKLKAELEKVSRFRVNLTPLLFHYSKTPKSQASLCIQVPIGDELQPWIDFVEHVTYETGFSRRGIFWWITRDRTPVLPRYILKTAVVAGHPYGLQAAATSKKDELTRGIGNAATRVTFR